MQTVYSKASLQSLCVRAHVYRHALICARMWATHSRLFLFWRSIQIKMNLHHFSENRTMTLFQLWAERRITGLIYRLNSKHHHCFPPSLSRINTCTHKTSVMKYSFHLHLIENSSFDDWTAIEFPWEVVRDDRPTLCVCGHVRACVDKIGGKKVS